MVQPRQCRYSASRHARGGVRSHPIRHRLDLTTDRGRLRSPLAFELPGDRSQCPDGRRNTNPLIRDASVLGQNDAGRVRSSPAVAPDRGRDGARLARTGASVAICGRRPPARRRTDCDRAQAPASPCPPSASPTRSRSSSQQRSSDSVIDLLVNNAGGQFMAPAGRSRQRLARNAAAVVRRGP